MDQDCKEMLAEKMLKEFLENIKALGFQLMYKSEFLEKVEDDR